MSYKEQGGWIRIHRQIQQNPIFKKPDYLAVWVYMLTNANYSDTHLILDGKKTKIHSGSFVGSFRNIANHFGFSTSHTKRIVEYLKTERMVEHTATSKYSLFKIRNWDKFQTDERTVERYENAERTQREHNENENKNIKKVKKYNNSNFSKSYPQRPPREVTLHDGSKAIRKFGEWVDANDPNVKISIHYYPELKQYE